MDGCHGKRTSGEGNLKRSLLRATTVGNGVKSSPTYHSPSGGGDVGDAELKFVRVSQLCYAEECRCGLCEVRLFLREMIFRYWFPGAQNSFK